MIARRAGENEYVRRTLQMKCSSTYDTVVSGCRCIHSFSFLSQRAGVLSNIGT
jgi:hypothetical protein